jgi:hypothetical protein
VRTALRRGRPIFVVIPTPPGILDLRVIGASIEIASLAKRPGGAGSQRRPRGAAQEATEGARGHQGEPDRGQPDGRCSGTPRSAAGCRKRSSSEGRRRPRLRCKAISGPEKGGASHRA